MLKNCFLLIFLFSTSLTFAQDNPENKKVWTLAECISYATENSLAIRRSELTLEGTKVAYDQSKAAFLPSVNAGVTHYFNFGRTIDRTSNQFVTQNTQNGALQLTGNLNVFNGLQNQYNLKRYKNQFQADLASIEQAKYDVSLNVASFYLDILFNNELLEAAKLQLLSSEEQVTRTEKLVNAGALAESSLLEVKAQLATEKLNVVNAENQLALSKLYLLQALLLPANMEFDIVVPNVGDEIQELDPSLNPNSVYQIALETQPGVRSSELYIKTARYGELAAKSDRLPSISIGGGISTNYSSQFRKTYNMAYENQIRENRGEYISVGLNIPIFNNYQVRSQIQNAEIARRRAELDLWEVKNNLRQSVEQAYQNAKAGEVSFKTRQDQVASLREAFRVNEQRFNVGAINSLDYTLAKNNLNKAESDLIRAKYDYIFRLKILDFYQNKPLTLTSQ